MGNEGEVSVVRSERQDSNLADTDILLKLRSLAAGGNIRAAAICHILDKQVPGGPILKFIQMHIEHVVGKAIISAVPVDESASLVSPALSAFGGPTQSKIFPHRS
jgi:hypothetical protein